VQASDILGTVQTAFEGVNSLKVREGAWYWCCLDGPWIQVYKVHLAPPGDKTMWKPVDTENSCHVLDMLVPHVLPVKTLYQNVTIEKYVDSVPYHSMKYTLTSAAIPEVIPIEDVPPLLAHVLDTIKEAARKRLAR